MTETSLAEPSRWRVGWTRLRQWSNSTQARWLWRVLGAISFIVINGYIVYTLWHDWGKIRTFDWLHVNAGFLALTAVVQFIGMCIAVFIWKYVMGRLGNSITYRQHFRAYALSFLAQKLPGLGWSIVSKVYLYGQNGADKVQVAVASGLEQLVAGVSGALAALVVLLLAGPEALTVQPIVPLAAVTVFIAILFLPPVRKGLVSLSQRVQGGNLRWPDLLLWLITATLVTLLGGLALYLFIRALGMVDQSAMLPLVQAWALFVFAGTLLFWMPVDLGVNVAILILVLTQLTSPSLAVIALIAWRIWNNIIVLTWVVMGILATRNSTLAIAQAAAPTNPTKHD